MQEKTITLEGVPVNDINEFLNASYDDLIKNKLFRMSAKSCLDVLNSLSKKFGMVLVEQLTHKMIEEYKINSKIDPGLTEKLFPCIEQYMKDQTLRALLNKLWT